MERLEIIHCLERILNWLQQNAPSYIEGFLPGLSYEEIEEKVSNLPFKLSEEVYNLYHWRNGTNSQAMIFVYHYFWHLDMVLEISSDCVNDPLSQEFRQQAGEPLYLFPIFEYEGEYFAVAGQTTLVETAPVYHIDADAGEVRLAFNSLTAMMQTIAETYETGGYYLTPEGQLEWDDKKFRSIRLKYNPELIDDLYVY
ncbi:hypothetical protein BCD64_24570 [Nostoc sp. MBR 210]|nr:hypothetical protein BCD64_24570 [Nostoc sp. MBR 210]